ncbi:MAG: DUF6541 family protein [Chloroflexota bacterium]
MPEILFMPLPRRRPVFWVCATLLLALLLSVCATMSDPEASQGHTQDIVASLDPGQAVGQTFTVRRPNVNGIHLWLNGEADATGTVTLKLYTTPKRTTLLAAVTVAQSSLVKNGPTHIPLAGRFPKEEAQPQPYYLVIQANGSPIDVLGRGENAYAGGSLYRLDSDTATPANADLAFRLTYRYDTAALWRDLAQAQGRLWLIVPFGALLVLPGWLLLEAAGIRRQYDMGEQTALSIGLSLAALPLLLLWSTIAGLHWNAALVQGAGIVVTGLSIWRWLVGLSRWQASRFANQPGANPAQFRPQGYLLWLVFAVTLFVRLAMVRDLAAPAWVDSVHHATITRLILDHGQFPENYLPYLDIDAQEYHAGYHAGLAAFLWLCGSDDLAGDMLIYGQVLNALSIFTVYCLARFLTKSQTGGVIAALIAGTLTPMPAYYASWGRYTQLAGLLIVPVVIVCFQTLVSQKMPASYKPRYLMLLALAAGGMFIVHYRVAAYSALLLLALFLCELRWNRPANLVLFRQTAGWAAAAGGLAFLVAFPWAWPTLSNVFAPIIAQGGTPSKIFGDFSWDYLTTAMGEASLWLAVVGLLWGLLRRQRWAASLALWVALLLLMANLGPMGVPGASMFSNNTAVTIVFFLPIAILGGDAIGQAYRAGKGIFPAGLVKFARAGLSLLLIWLSVAGAQRLLPLLRPSTLLFRNADHQALKWMRTNVPPDETVLINPFLWGYNLYAGSDGGFWISPLAERRSLPPPVLYGMNTAEEIRRVNSLCQRVIEDGESATALWEMLNEHGIRYVYVGARGGPISAAALQESQLFETLYEKDGTWVFEVTPAPSEP